jgi:ribonuclease P protein subunit RPR2
MVKAEKRTQTRTMTRAKVRTRGKKPEYQLRIARERIEILLSLAEKELRKRPKRSRRYVELARKIGMRYNVRLTKQQKRSFCKACDTLLKPGVTSKQRTEKGVIIIKCQNCNKIYRYPFRKAKKKKVKER